MYERVFGGIPFAEVPNNVRLKHCEQRRNHARRCSNLSPWWKRLTRANARKLRSLRWVPHYFQNSSDEKWTDEPSFDSKKWDFCVISLDLKKESGVFGAFWCLCVICELSWCDSLSLSQLNEWNCPPNTHFYRATYFCFGSIQFGNFGTQFADSANIVFFYNF